MPRTYHGTSGSVRNPTRGPSNMMAGWQHGQLGGMSSMADHLRSTRRWRGGLHGRCCSRRITARRLRAARLCRDQETQTACGLARSRGPHISAREGLVGTRGVGGTCIKSREGSGRTGGRTWPADVAVNHYPAAQTPWSHGGRGTLRWVPTVPCRDVLKVLWALITPRSVDCGGSWMSVGSLSLSSLAYVLRLPPKPTLRYEMRKLKQRIAANQAARLGWRSSDV